MTKQESSLRQQIRSRLGRGEIRGLGRTLKSQEGLIDFSSNDYLGLARSLPSALDDQPALARHLRGATGSRLVSGHTPLYEAVEARIAQFHYSESALIFSSGYLANISLIGAVVGRHSTILYDQLIHASLRDGIRLSQAKAYSFRHNDMAHLEEKARRAAGSFLIVIESLYSMDGDLAPLDKIVDIAERYGGEVIVDEAHAVGIEGLNGRGLVSKSALESRVLARTVTFGKALGCHGAAILSDSLVRQSLINYGRGFMFSTALPPQVLWEIDRSYQALLQIEDRRQQLMRNIQLYNAAFCLPVSSLSPIQKIIVPGNQAVLCAAELLNQKGLSVVAIRSPSVPVGQERLRICLHSFNSKEDVCRLIEALQALPIGEG